MSILYFVFYHTFSYASVFLSILPHFSIPSPMLTHSVPILLPIFSQYNLFYWENMGNNIGTELVNIGEQMKKWGQIDKKTKADESVW